MNIGPTELIVVLIVALVIFGPGKLPELGQMLGKGIREFKGAINNIDEDIKKDLADLKNDVKDAVKVDVTEKVEPAKTEDAAQTAAEQK